MSLDAWILGAPLKVLRQEDHPYRETTLATLGRHELGLSRRQSTAAPPGCEIFLDGRSIYLPGAPAPDRAWFDLCRELGYEPVHHWDWDPALILFQQVLPALAADWHEPPLNLNAHGLPEGVLSLASLRQTFAEAVSDLRQDSLGPVGAKVAETFEWLPLRAVVFHDDAQLPLDFEGAGSCGRVSLWLGIHRDRAVALDGPTPFGPGLRRWAAAGSGDRAPGAACPRAAGPDPEPPKPSEAPLDPRPPPHPHPPGRLPAHLPRGHPLAPRPAGAAPGAHHRGCPPGESPHARAGRRHRGGPGHRALALLGARRNLRSKLSPRARACGSGAAPGPR